MTRIDTATIPSPLGPIILAAHAGRLCALTFGDDANARLDRLTRHFGPVAFREAADPAGAVSALTAYFAGRLDALDLLAVAPCGTPFQAAVWRALRTIPPGRTRSYGELAEALGAPRAARAVGAANRQNPIALVIPCHRVVGRDHRLVGYASGLDRKRWLLEHEGALARPASDTPAQRRASPALPDPTLPWRRAR